MLSYRSTLPLLSASSSSVRSCAMLLSSSSSTAALAPTSTFINNSFALFPSVSTPFTSNPLGQQTRNVRTIRRVAPKKTSVVFLKDLQGTAFQGEMKTVSDGYVRSNLVPFGKALPENIYKQELTALVGRTASEKLLVDGLKASAEKRRVYEEKINQEKFLTEIHKSLLYTGIVFFPKLEQLQEGISKKSIAKTIKSQLKLQLNTTAFPPKFNPITKAGLHFVPVRLTDRHIGALKVVVVMPTQTPAEN